MHAAPMEDFERLEQEFQEFRDAIVDLLEVCLLTQDKADLAAAVRIAHETIKERNVFRPDFEMEWEVGPDVDIRFEPEEDDGA